MGELETPIERKSPGKSVEHFYFGQKKKRSILFINDVRFKVGAVGYSIAPTGDNR